MKKNGVKARRGKWWVIGAPYVWLMLMLMIPFLYLLSVSLSEMVQGGGYLPRWWLVF